MKKLYKKVLLGVLVGGVCLAATTGLAAEQRGSVQDGELFMATTMYKNTQTLYKNDAIENWVWHGTDGYPLGMGFLALANGGDLPELPREKDFQGGVPTKEEMLNNARNQYAIQKYENKLVLYGTTGPSAAQTNIAFKEVKLVGRLLNVVVYLTNAKPNTPLTMNLIYPETMITIAKNKLPATGSLRVRFADNQGHTLQISDVELGR